MKMFGQSDHQFLGSEFDWLAVDRDGCVGYFSTAGAGWIPDSVLASPEPYWDSLDLVMELPIVGPAQSCFLGNHDVRDWLNIASRGIYAFDWNRGTKRYELVARPTSLYHGLEEAVFKLAHLTRLPCKFASDFPDLESVP